MPFRGTFRDVEVEGQIRRDEVDEIDKIEQKNRQYGPKINEIDENDEIDEIDDIDGKNRRNRRKKSTKNIDEIDEKKTTKSTKSTKEIGKKSTKSTKKIDQIDKIDEKQSTKSTKPTRMLSFFRQVWWRGHFWGPLFCDFFLTSLRGWGAGSGSGLGVAECGDSGPKGGGHCGATKRPWEEMSRARWAGCSDPHPVGLAPVDFAMSGLRMFPKNGKLILSADSSRGF